MSKYFNVLQPQWAVDKFALYELIFAFDFGHIVQALHHLIAVIFVQIHVVHFEFLLSVQKNFEPSFGKHLLPQFRSVIHGLKIKRYV